MRRTLVLRSVSGLIGNDPPQVDHEVQPKALLHQNPILFSCRHLLYVTLKKVVGPQYLLCVL